MKAFHFKKFSVAQDRCAMKIGTDGVLLGAWTSLENNPEAILDIGAGTGVIALMLAQRSQTETIDGLEIDANAYEQCVDNFENSPWGDRLFCYHASFDEFAQEMDEPYDLIVSNPPFHTEDYLTGNKPRDQARFSSALSFSELLQGTVQLLAESGIFSVIIPKSRETEFVKSALENHLHLQKRTEVRGNPTSPVKRSLLQFGFDSKPVVSNSLTIEKSRHDYTEEYKTLTKDFYLKM